MVYDIYNVNFMYESDYASDCRDRVAICNPIQSFEWRITASKCDSFYKSWLKQFRKRTQSEIQVLHMFSVNLECRPFHLTEATDDQICN